jgi:RimJ/RimL family protein N-acetyltransferase
VLTLVDFEPTHFDELISWFGSEREVVQWGGIALQHPLDHAQLQAILDEGLTDPPARHSWMAVTDGRLVGHIELALHPETASARLGRVGIAPVDRGRRLGPQLVALALHAAWGLDWVQRVDLRVYTFNAPALATYRRLGFVTETIAQESRVVDGERWEVATMAVDRSAADDESSPASRRGSSFGP